MYQDKRKEQADKMNYFDCHVDTLTEILKPVLSIVLALVLGAAVIAMVGENPLSVYRSMLLGAFGSKMSIQKDSCWKPARIIWSLQMKN